MAVLTTAERRDVLREIGELLSDKRQLIGLTKPELVAAIDAVDDWVNDNAAAFNNALPTAAKANLSANQKGRLLSIVVAKRLEVS